MSTVGLLLAPRFLLLGTYNLHGHINFLYSIYRFASFNDTSESYNYTQFN